jgi:hypothetical protein
MDLLATTLSLLTSAADWPQNLKWYSVIVKGTKLPKWQRSANGIKEKGGSKIFSPFKGVKKTGKRGLNHSTGAAFDKVDEYPCYHEHGFAGPQAQIVFDELKVNVDCCQNILNMPQIASVMGLTRKQATTNNIFLPVAKLTQQNGYVWTAAQHRHSHPNCADTDLLHWHILIGVPESSTSLRQTEVYKTLSKKIEPLTFTARNCTNPILLAIYNIWGKLTTACKDRLFLGTNNKLILELLQDMDANVVGQAVQEVKELDCVEDVELTEEMDPCVMEMLKGIVQDLESNMDEEDLAAMVPDTPTPKRSRFANLASTSNPLGESPNKCKKTKIDYMLDAIQYCVHHRLYCQDDLSKHQCDLINAMMVIPPPLASMMTFDRNNKTILDRASQIAYQNGVSPYMNVDFVITCDLIAWLNCLKPTQFNAMFAWAMVLTGKTPEKESNVYIHGAPNAGKSYMFGRPMIDIFKLVNCNLNQDKAFFANEMASYALMSVFDDITVNIKDMTCLEILKNILAKNQVELNTKYTSKEKSKNRPILFLNNCQFFDIIGELGDTKVHMDALHARFFYEGPVTRFPYCSEEVRAQVWQILFYAASLEMAITKAEYMLQISEDPTYFQAQTMRILYSQEEEWSQNSLFPSDPVLGAAVSENV